EPLGERREVLTEAGIRIAHRLGEDRRGCGMREGCAAPKACTGRRRRLQARSMLSGPGTCPWDGLRAATGAPNLDWCEAEVCGWAVEPANTWSNLAYFVVAAWLLWRRRRAAPPALELVGWL